MLHHTSLFLLTYFDISLSTTAFVFPSSLFLVQKYEEVVFLTEIAFWMRGDGNNNIAKVTVEEIGVSVHFVTSRCKS